MATTRKLQELISLSRELGHVGHGLAITGEGNTSAALDEGTFWIKVSGASLGGITARGFCRVDAARALALLDDPRCTDDNTGELLRGTLLRAGDPRPSIETMLHALCLADPEIRFVAHTHPPGLLRILCSRAGVTPFRRHCYPFAVVTCGRHIATVGYHNPGLALARAVRTELARYRRAHGRSPHLLLLANHGAVALARTAPEALNISLMAEKWAQLLDGTQRWGGPAFLPAHAFKHLNA
ncbi:MAG: class II aldolase/adducin family protein [Kiritimatiellaeota bacterium]|nr:class II aldolase/adducin family protein [Kiritimatiellota bacterium]